MTSRSRLRSTTKIAATASAAGLALLLGTAPAASALSMPAATAAAAVPHPATTPIKHFVFLMQGGRTFDNYFGTYPGADGLGTGTCQPLAVGDPAGQCVKPFLLDNSERAPLGANATIIASQLNGGKMDGFVAAYQQQGRDGAMAMGYYNATQLALLLGSGAELRALRPLLLLGPVRHQEQPLLLGLGQPGARRHGPDTSRRLRESADDLRPAAGGTRQLEVLRAGLQPRRRPTSRPRRISTETQTARVPLVDFQRFTHDPALASHIVGLDQYYRDLAGGHVARGGLRGVVIRRRRALRAVHPGRSEHWSAR